MNSSSAMPENAFTVLLAEDEPMLRAVVRETLRRAGYTVIEAADGTAGLEILQSDLPIDVLLTDIKMPGLNGYQLAQQMRHTPELAHAGTGPDLSPYGLDLAWFTTRERDQAEVLKAYKARDLDRLAAR